MSGADLIIDGYNLIFRLAPEALDAPQRLAEYRRRLEQAVRRFGEAEARRPWIVYDGRRLPGPAAGARQEDHLRVSFAEPPAEADDFICQMATQARSGGREVTVVTSDGDLAGRLRSVGAAVVAVEAFGEGLAPAAARSEGAVRLPDVERFFLDLHAQEEAVRALVERQERAPRQRDVPASARRRPAEGGQAQAPDSRERRRQRGLRRQARRLASSRRAGGKKPHRRR